MRTVKALGAGIGTALVGCGITLMIPGVSESTAAIVGAVAAVAAFTAVVYYAKAKVKEEGTARLHYNLIGDRFKEGLVYLDRDQ